MEQNRNGSNDPTRLDRIERNLGVIAIGMLESQHDLKTLLKGQLALREGLQKGFAELSEALERFAAAQDRFEKKLRQTQQRIDGFIGGTES